MIIDLDNNATTRPLPQVVEAVVEGMGDAYGNPSSPHGRGIRARATLTRHINSIAGFANLDPEGLLLTSGGTESNNLVFSSIASRRATPRIAVSAAEHSSVLRPAEVAANGNLRVLPLNRDGTVDLETLAAALVEGIDLVSVQWASGETGVVQPVKEIARLCRAAGALLHVDAAQALGRLPLDAAEVDLMTLSAHKMHGPVGIGALWTRDRGFLAPALFGGGQQRGLRAGTENVPGAAGFAAACEARAAAFAEAVARMVSLRDRFEQAVLADTPDATVNGAGAPRLCNTTNIRFPGVDGQALVANLDRSGILCSQTSACASGRPEPAPVLRAMGLSEAQAWSSVRFSFSILNTPEEADEAARTVAATVRRLRDVVVM